MMGDKMQGRDLYERVLFVTAGCFNWAVGLLILGGYPLAAHLLEFAGPPTVWVHLVAAIVVLFGIAYWLVAKQPQRYRPFVGLGAAGKLAFAATIYYHWFSGDASARLVMLVNIDVIFALLFLRYLVSHRTRVR
jgi:hypothetical protein